MYLDLITDDNSLSILHISLATGLPLATLAAVVIMCMGARCAIKGKRRNARISKKQEKTLDTNNQYRYSCIGQDNFV